MTRLLVAWVVWLAVWAGFVAVVTTVALHTLGFGEAIVAAMLSVLVGLLVFIPLDRVERQVRAARD